MNYGVFGNWFFLMCISCCLVEVGLIVLFDVIMLWLVWWWLLGDFMLLFII